MRMPTFGCGTSPCYPDAAASALGRKSQARVMSRASTQTLVEERGGGPPLRLERRVLKPAMHLVIQAVFTLHNKTYKVTAAAVATAEGSQ